MSRKDYIILAHAIAEARKLPGEHQLPSFVATLTATLKRDNPRFNRERFLSACGMAED